MIDQNAHTWDEKRTTVEIESLLPSGWQFQLEEEATGYVSVAFLDSAGVSQWTDHGPSAQLILFNAYGWIVARTTLATNTGPWRRRQELTLKEVNAEALRKARVPDPDDLDPDKLQAVYDALKK